MTVKELEVLLLFATFLAVIFFILFLSELNRNSYLKKDIDFAAKRINKLLKENKELTKQVGKRNQK